MAKKTTPQQRPKKPPKGVKARQAAQAKKNRQIALGAIGVVVVAVVAIIAFGGKGTPSPTPSTGGDTAKVVHLVTSVPATVLDQVGPGQGVSPPQMLPASTPPLTQGGKPEVFFYGAEYCPYCAAQRWPVTVALSRFGTFSGVGLMFSSSTDTPSSVPTLTFHGATYTSDYLAFVPVEGADRNGKPLETPTAAQQLLLSTYDPGANGPPIPFLMIGNKYVERGTSIDPNPFAGKTQLQLATALSDPSASTTQSIAGSANVITAAICKLTNGQPTNVCTATGVKAAEIQLPTTPAAAGS